MDEAAGGWRAVTMQFTETLAIETAGREMRDVTRRVQKALADRQAGDGLLTLFLRHTSASLTVQENASPEVRSDLLDALDRLAPEDAPWRHTLEGRDDMPAHVKTSLTATSLAVPVSGGRMVLGTWQGLYVVEHRARPHRRELVLHFVGTKAG